MVHNVGSNSFFLIYTVIFLGVTDNINTVQLIQGGGIVLAGVDYWNTGWN